MKGKTMSKDKSTKSTKSTKTFAKPSEAPAGGDGWSLTDGDKPGSGRNDGELFLITPLRKQTVETKDYGEKEVIVSDVVQINTKKPEKSEEHEEVFVFGGWLQGSLRAYIGTEQVLGRLVKTADKKAGRGYVWKLEDADSDDVKAATAYVASLSPFPATDGGSSKKKSKSAPVETKPGKKSKAEPEPVKTKKKSKK